MSESQQSRKLSRMHGGPGSGRYPAGSGDNETDNSKVWSCISDVNEDSKISMLSFDGQKDNFKDYFYAVSADDDTIIKYVGAEEDSGDLPYSNFINQALRTGVYNESLGMSKKSIEDAVSSLDDAMASAPSLVEGTKLYRGMSGNSAKALLSASVGDVISDKGYQSFTFSPNVAGAYAERHGEDIVVVQAITNSGVKAVFVPENPNSLTGNDMELIVNRDTKWKILSKATKVVDMGDDPGSYAPGRKLSRAPAKVTIVSVVLA